MSREGFLSEQVMEVSYLNHERLKEDPKDKWTYSLFT
jgi:hypothetical protein